MDGLALYGKYEDACSTMDGYAVELDDYGSHAHEDYGQHYHAHDKNVTGSWGSNSYSFTKMKKSEPTRARSTTFQGS